MAMFVWCVLPSLATVILVPLFVVCVTMGPPGKLIVISDLLDDVGRFLDVFGFDYDPRLFCQHVSFSVFPSVVAILVPRAHPGISCYNIVMRLKTTIVILS